MTICVNLWRVAAGRTEFERLKSRGISDRQGAQDSDKRNALYDHIN